ncbi:anti-phage ZorAB system protein ZorA [Methylorubrum aminovorans]
MFLVGYALSYLLPILSSKSNLGLMIGVVQEVGRGDFGNVGHSEFAFALACAIVSTAAAIAFAMLFTHVVAVRASLRTARKELGASTTPKAFLQDFDRVNQRLREHPLVGHAWEEFAKTCMRKTAVVRTTRPSAFLSPATARERLPGLKLMPTIPGYFVGLGLLLTFVGLVIALSKAAGGVTGSPENMTQALRELLDAATFKFSTSIAGLFSSLALAFLFKVYAIAIEGGFERFCREVERRTTLLTNQDALVDLAEAGREQLQQLKEINDVQFFDRLGQALGPTLSSAVGDAVKPLAAQLEATVGKLEDNSRTGTEGLLKQFSETLHGTAGTELKELAAALGQMKDALGNVRGDLSGSGEEFARRMAEATDTLGRLIAGAGDQFSANNAATRETVGAVLEALRQSADVTKERINRDIADAGAAASDAVRGGMAEMLAQVGAQMAAFRDTMASIQDQATRGASDATTKAKDAADAAAAAAGKAAADAAEAIRGGLVDTVSQLRGDVDRLSEALRSAERSFEAQSRASLATVERTSAASEAFGKVAGDIAAASRPLLQASDRIATSTGTLAEAAKGAAESLQVGQEAARALATRLEEGNRQIEAAWRNYEERFGAVDQALSEAVRSLAAETTNQQQVLSDFVLRIDAGCAQAVQRLQATTATIQENTAEIGEVFEDFLGRMPRQAMANA